MSYPRQQGSFRMPMPQNYGGYGQQQQRPSYPPSTQQQHGYPSGYPTSQQQQQQSYPHHHQQVRPTSSYPSYSQPTSQPYSSQSTPPYPSTQIQSMSINNSNVAPLSSSQQSYGGLQTSVENATKNLTALIKDATYEDLDHLVNNEDKMIDLVQDSTEVKDLREKIQSLTNDIKDQAVTNLSLEPDLQHTREELIKLAREQNELKQQYVEIQSQLSGKVSLDGILAVLQAETSQSDGESENIAQAFMDADNGNEFIDKFIGSYMDKRIEYHLRKVKTDQMTSLMANLSANTGGAPTRQPQMPNAYGYGGY